MYLMEDGSISDKLPEPIVGHDANGSPVIEYPVALRLGDDWLRLVNHNQD